MTRCFECGATVAAATATTCPGCGSALSQDDMDTGIATPDREFARVVEAFEAEVREGRDPDVDDWCQRHPASGPRLRKALIICKQLAMLADDAGAAPDEPLPQRLGPYRVLGEIGRGGMGFVVRARDDRLGRDVAIKVLPRDLFGRAQHRQRFAREARAMARLHHPHVVTIHDVGDDGETAYLVMDLLDGSVADVIGRAEAGEAPMPTIAERLRWIHEAAAGLQHLHDAGIVHRDVKPNNLLIDAAGRVRIGDLGLAFMEGEPELTRTGQAMGTALYAAPEQLRGEPASPSGDVYALAATAHRLFAGRAPRANPAETDYRADVPPALRRFLLRALSPDPALRPRDPAAFSRELDAAMRPARRGRIVAAAAGAGVLLAAAAIVVGRDGAAGPVTRALGPDDRIHFMVADEDAYSTRAAFAFLRRTRTFAALLASATGASDRARLRLDGADHVVEVEPHGEDAAITIRRGDDIVAGGTFTSMLGRPASEWKFSTERIDGDGDGVPGVLLANGREIALVEMDAAALGLAGAGWVTPVASAFGEGSPTLAPGFDGVTSVFVADTGSRLDTGLFETAYLHRFDAATGRLLQSWPIHEPVQSTPRALLDRGRLRHLYVDTQPPFAHAAGTLMHVDAARPEAIEPLDVPGRGRLTWPLFADVDGDGRDEVVVGRRFHGPSGVDGLVACLDPDASHAVSWTHRCRGALDSYPILSQQDTDPEPEACFASLRGFACLDVQATPAGGDRVAWSCSWDRDVTFASGSTEVGDIDGDGLAEIAVGDQDVGGHVFSKAATDGVLARLRAPEEALAVPVLPRGIVGRLVATPDAAPGEARLLGLTTGGWIVRWRVTRDGAQVTSASFFGASSYGDATTASPVLIRLKAAGDGADPGARWGVLVLGGVLALLEPSAEDPERLVPTWSSWTCLNWGQGTPVVRQDPGGAWAIVTDHSGRLRRVALPDRAALPGA